MTTEEAVKKLISELREDPDYRRSWKDNISVCFQDQYSWDKSHYYIREIANRAADNFLNLLCKERIYIIQRPVYVEKRQLSIKTPKKQRSKQKNVIAAGEQPNIVW